MAGCSLLCMHKSPTANRCIGAGFLTTFGPQRTTTGNIGSGLEVLPYTD